MRQSRLERVRCKLKMRKVEPDIENGIMDNLPELILSLRSVKGRVFDMSGLDASPSCS